MTFKQYLRRTHAGENARGDFIRDALRDPEMPDDFQSFEGLRSYLRRVHRAEMAVINAAELVWNDYQASR